MGIDRLLNRQELNAVLLREMAHASRRDNLIRLVHEASLCALWFHPLVWLAGRMALYRELSCDEPVIQRSYGQELVSALAKLAVPDKALFCKRQPHRNLSYRLARYLVGPAQATHRAASPLLTLLFTAVIAAGVFATVAHTACCFVPKH